MNKGNFRYRNCVLTLAIATTILCLLKLIFDWQWLEGIGEYIILAVIGVIILLLILDRHRGEID